MSYNIINNSTDKLSTLIKMMEAYLPYAKKNIGFDQSVTIVLESDAENAKNPLGKTAYYSPSDYTVVLYTDNRHPKDVMRSLNHELVHHKQNCDGRLGGVVGEEGYAQTKVGSAIEAEAYEDLTFRNWEDRVKKQVNETSYNKRNKKMKLTKTKLRKIIKEALEKAGSKRTETALESPEELSEEEDASAEEIDENNDENTDIVEEEKPLKGWWNESLYTNLIKRYTKSK